MFLKVNLNIPSNIPTYHFPFPIVIITFSLIRLGCGWCFGTIFSLLNQHFTFWCLLVSFLLLVSLINTFTYDYFYLGLFVSKKRLPGICT